jgi:hypothetical protein
VSLTPAAFPSFLTAEAVFLMNLVHGDSFAPYLREPHTKEKRECPNKLTVRGEVSP